MERAREHGAQTRWRAWLSERIPQNILGASEVAKSAEQFGEQQLKARIRTMSRRCGDDISRGVRVPTHEAQLREHELRVDVARFEGDRAREGLLRLIESIELRERAAAVDIKNGAIEAERFGTRELGQCFFGTIELREQGAEIVMSGGMWPRDGDRATIGLDRFRQAELIP